MLPYTQWLMASSPPLTSYNLLSEGMTESAPTMPSGIQTPSQRHSEESVLLITHYLYLHVKAEGITHCHLHCFVRM